MFVIITEDSRSSALSFRVNIDIYKIIFRHFTPCILIIINLLQYHFLAFNSRMFRKLQFRMPKLILFSSNGFGFRFYFRFLHQEDTITKEVCCRSYILLLVCIPGEEMFFKKSLAHIPFFRNKNMMLLQCDLE